MGNLAFDVAAEVRQRFRGRELERYMDLGEEEGYRCVGCGALDRPSALNRASVIVMLYADGANVVLAHRACLRSGVVTVPGSVHQSEPPEPEAASGTITFVTNDGTHHSVLFMAVPGHDRALLPSGDVLDQALSHLIEAGWMLLPSAEDMLSAPLLGPEWVVELDPTGTAQALGAFGLLLSDLPYEPEWAEDALARGEVVMVIGRLGRDEPMDTFPKIKAAVRRGSAVGARLTAVRVRP
jgi:hypothetical protein